MAASLIQAPLPWLPEGAVEVARGVGIVAGEDGSGQVWVHGMMTFCWDAGDEASRRLAMVQLTVHLRAASMRQAAGPRGQHPARRITKAQVNGPARGSLGGTTV